MNFLIKTLSLIIFIYLVRCNRFTPFTDMDVLVNYDSSMSNTRGGVDVLNDSSFIVCWEYSNSIVGQMYDPSLARVKTQIIVSGDKANRMSSPYVVNLPKKDRFVIVYQDFNLVKVFFRIYDDDFNLIREGSVNTVNNDYAGCDIWPKVASNLDGTFFITWNISNGNWGWNVRARIYDSNGLPLTDDMKINDNCNADESQSMPCSLSNGNFVITYHSNASGIHQVYYRIYSPNGQAIVNKTLVNLNPKNKSWIPHCKGLSNGGFVISYETFNDIRPTIVFRLFNADGSPLDYIENQVSTTPTSGMTWSTITPLPTGFVVAFYKSDTDSYFQAFSNKGESINAETRFHQLTQGTQSFPVVASYGDGFVITWQGDDTKYINKYIQLFDYQKTDCVDMTLFLKKGELSKINFPSLPNPKVKINTFGVVTFTNKDIPMSIEDFYPSDQIYFKTDIPKVLEYKNSEDDSSCNINILLCFDSCNTCKGLGDDTNHLCGSCAAGFYPVQDTLQCYSSGKELPQNYFNNGTLRFEKCYISCFSCTGEGKINNHMCSKCALGYQNVDDLPGQCFQYDDTVPGYTLINDTFEKCTGGCSSLKYILIVCFIIIFLALLIF
jgi:hypothetical protein